MLCLCNRAPFVGKEETGREWAAPYKQERRERFLSLTCVIDRSLLHVPSHIPISLFNGKSGKSYLQ